jgi:hypothetical protein
MKRLAAQKMAIDAVPAGGGLQSAIAFLSDKQAILNGARNAQKWANEAVQAIRSASDPNPWRNSTDEEIATELLRRIELKKGEHRNA